MTITEFLTARLDEDEAVAQDAQHSPGKEWSWASVDYNSAVAEAHGGRWSPDRVLAEVEAKRALIVDMETFQLVAKDDPMAGVVARGIEHALRRFAALDADHPDYDEAWRP